MQIKDFFSQRREDANLFYVTSDGVKNKEVFHHPLFQKKIYFCRPNLKPVKNEKRDPSKRV